MQLAAPALGLRLLPAAGPDGPVPDGLGRCGSLEVRLAGPDEIAAAQRLRFRVFFDDGAALPSAAARRDGRDSDRFDPHCDHLVVLDGAVAGGPAVVGTYRLLRRAVADRQVGFYSAGPFDLAPLLAAHPATEFLELGRACVLPAYRSRRTAELLWQGIWRYVLWHRVGALFGCASLPGIDPAGLAEPLGFLRAHARSAWGERVRARPGRGVPVPAAPPVDVRRAFAALPPLVKGYLRVGAGFGPDAVPDPAFGSTDLFAILPVPDVSARYRCYFGSDRTGGRSAASPSRYVG